MACRKIILVCLWWMLAAALTGVSAQTLLNGGFENNTFDCGYNLPNFIFNQGMQDVTAFGGKEEIDVMDESCGYGPAFEGEDFIAMFYHAHADAVALHLSAPLEPGRTYVLHFAVKNGLPPGEPAGKIRIGLSSLAFASGDLLFETPAAGQAWEELTVTFKPEQAYAFVTAEITPKPGAWVFLDGFRFGCPQLDLGNDTTLCKVEGFELSVDPAFSQVSWSDGTAGNSFAAPGPGLYWAEGISGGCLDRDSILLYEPEHRCECQIYLPNVFSPNGDGLNDVFSPLTPCTLEDYEMAVFDRWGKMLFRSTDPASGWDGATGGRPAPSGVYAYWLRRRFAYDAAPSILKGELLLLR